MPQKETDLCMENDCSKIEISARELLSYLQQAGLNGLSGGGFPTATKIEDFMKSDAPKKYLIVNGVECEPGLLHDEWLFMHKYEEVKLGIEILKKCLPIEKAFMAAKRVNDSVGSEAAFVQIPDRYPMGQETLLIRSVLGLELQKDEIPAQKGILVLNIQTVLAIGRLVADSPKKHARYLTVANMPKALATVVEAPMGMAAADIAAKLLPAGADIYIGGGALNVHPLTSGEEIDATTGLIACGELITYDNDARCKGCGGCSAKCPAGVNVKGIIGAVEKGQTTGFEQFHPEKCIGCGTCSYICHAGKNTMEIVAQVNA